MTFNPSLYTPVVINDYDAGTTAFDDAGNFITDFRLKAAMIPYWAGKVAHALKIEVLYPIHYLTDEGSFASSVDGMTLISTTVTVSYSSPGGPVYNDLFRRDETTPGTANSVFQPEPLVFTSAIAYSGDPDFADYVAPGGSVNPYRYYMVLNTPTAMPTEAQLAESVTVHYNQHVEASLGISPVELLFNPGGPYYYQWALRLTVYVDGVAPPLRLFQRDDDLGKVGTARLGGHTGIGNAPSSLQRQSPPRLVQGGNVYL